MASTYRKRKGGGDTWHFCSNCQHWPRSNYDEQSTRPSGELCNECKSKRERGECT